MSGKSYARLYKRLKRLIAQGTKVADEKAGTPAAEIHKWMEEALVCLLFLEREIPTAVEDFKHIRESYEYWVEEEYEEASFSKSAYRPEFLDPSRDVWVEGEAWKDFRFDYLAQANGILKLAAQKVDMERRSSPETELGERLRKARQVAGQTQRQAADEIGYDHKYISEWETGIRIPRPIHAKNILVYILKHSEKK